MGFECSALRHRTRCPSGRELRVREGRPADACAMEGTPAVWQLGLNPGTQVKAWGGGISTLRNAVAQTLPSRPGTGVVRQRSLGRYANGEQAASKTATGESPREFESLAFRSPIEGRRVMSKSRIGGRGEAGADQGREGHGPPQRQGPLHACRGVRSDEARRGLVVLERVPQRCGARVGNALVCKHGGSTPFLSAAGLGLH